MPGITGAKGLDYAQEAQALIGARRQFAGSPQRRQEIVSGLLHSGVPRTHIQEYLGRGPRVRR